MKREEPNRAHQSALAEPVAAGRHDPQPRWDAERNRCPVSHDRGSEEGLREWKVSGHPEAVRILEDHETFSSAVSAHLSVPSGMDPPAHTIYREIVNRYFTPEAMQQFEPKCRKIIGEAMGRILEEGGGEAQSDLADICAVRMQCAFMGWPPSMREELTAWQEANELATRAGDKAATTAVAETFERKVGEILSRRRSRGSNSDDDTTSRLLTERINGEPIGDAELVSIIRNWTVGELGSIAGGIGILVQALAADPDLQSRLRREPELIAVAVDEVLRVRGPLLANRRVVTRAVELAGQRLEKGDRLRILWPAVNRDERVFAQAQQVDLEREQSENLLYGRGIHYCPGAPLARLELRVFVEELLGSTSVLELDPERPPKFAAPPRGGFERVYIRVER